MAFHKVLLFSLLIGLAVAAAGGTSVKNSGNVSAKQSQYQASGNDASHNDGSVNQQSSNQATQQAGNFNDADNYSKQTIKGRKLQGWYNIDDSGNVKAKQSQYQSSANDADDNSGPVNQQSSNQATQQAGNFNDADNFSKQTIKGRRLLGHYQYRTFYVDDHGNVYAKQSQYQSSGDNSSDNSGGSNQQSQDQVIQESGNGNSASNYQVETISGRKLLGDDFYVDDSGNVWAKQSQYQASENDASYNDGPVNQQSSNQATQQAGNFNDADNYDKQTIKGRKLQGWYNIDDSGNVKAKQSQYQSSANDADYNSGPVNQQSSNQATQQAGNFNDADNYNKQTIKP